MPVSIILVGLIFFPSKRVFFTGHFCTIVKACSCSLFIFPFSDDGIDSVGARFGPR